MPIYIYVYRERERERETERERERETYLSIYATYALFFLYTHIYKANIVSKSKPQIYSFLGSPALNRKTDSPGPNVLSHHAEPPKGRFRVLGFRGLGFL